MTTYYKSNKPVHWADMCRVWTMMGLMRDGSKSECLRVRREILKPLLDSGRVVRVDWGLYKFTDDVVLHRTPDGNELIFHPDQSL